LGLTALDRDALTGLLLRASSLIRGEERLASRRDLLLAIVNVDQFKRFNMHNGHQRGDLILQEINSPQPVHCGEKHCMGPAPAPRVSIGLSSSRNASFQEMIAQAEAALKRAKLEGRNRVCR